VIATHRGDTLVGPDNGVLLPAARVLGGIVEIREISNRSLMRPSVSALFHGRDMFCPAAAHMANGVSFESFGSLVAANSLIGAPYSEAGVRDGRWTARVIHIDKFGNAHLNIASHSWRAARGAGGWALLLSSAVSTKSLSSRALPLARSSRASLSFSTTMTAASRSPSIKGASRQFTA
jgi:S-adenosylmethionine hydrolase